MAVPEVQECPNAGAQAALTGYLSPAHQKENYSEKIVPSFVPHPVKKPQQFVSLGHSTRYERIPLTY
jgi:hypothetical protein